MAEHLDPRYFTSELKMFDAVTQKRLPKRTVGHALKSLIRALYLHMIS